MAKSRARTKKSRRQKASKIFLVEKVLDKRVNGDKIEYLLKWKEFNEYNLEINQNKETFY